MTNTGADLDKLQSTCKVWGVNEIGKTKTTTQTKPPETKRDTLEIQITTTQGIIC